MEEYMRIVDEELNIKNDKRSQENDKKKTLEKKYLKLDLPYDDLSTEERIFNLGKYVSTQHGKQFRQKILLSLNYWFKVPEEVFNAVSRSMHILQNQGLMVDDIQDGTTLRRGIPCSHLVHGVAKTLNSLYFLTAKSFDPTLKLKHSAGREQLANGIAEAVRGQTMDVYWREKSICPTEEQYTNMVLKKTGVFFFMIIRFMASYSDENVDVPTVLRMFAFFSLYFQTNDDFINLWNEEYHKSKGFCEDITEGKFSFPIIYVVHNFPEEGKIIKDILSQRTHDMEVLGYCRSIIEKCGGMEYTSKACTKYRNKIQEEKNKLKPNPIFEEFLSGQFFIQGFAVVV